VIDSGVAVLGAKQGKRLVIYTNYRCPSCRAAQQEIDVLVAQDKKVRVIFYDFIPGYDQVATEASYLTRCAAQWGVFPRMRQELLAREPPPFGLPWYTESELPQLLRQLRVKKKVEFLECLGTDVYKAIERDTVSARELGFEYPPAFIAEGVPLVGTPSSESLTQALERGLKAQLQRSRVKVDGDRPRKRKKGRRWLQSDRRGDFPSRKLRSRVRPSRKQDMSVAAPPQSGTQWQPVQGPQPMTGQPPAHKHAAPKGRQEQLFDLD
jgi:hypothetical protein